MITVDRPYQIGTPCRVDNFNYRSLNQNNHKDLSVRAYCPTVFRCVTMISTNLLTKILAFRWENLENNKRKNRMNMFTIMYSPPTILLRKKKIQSKTLFLGWTKIINEKKHLALNIARPKKKWSELKKYLYQYHISFFIVYLIF
jgi:hypothetical protein